MPKSNWKCGLTGSSTGEARLSAGGALRREPPGPGEVTLDGLPIVVVEHSAQPSAALDRSGQISVCRAGE